MLTPPKLTNGNIPCVAFPVPPYKLLSSLKILQHFTFRMLNRFLFFRIRSNCSRSQFPELPRRFSPPQSRIRFSVSRNPSVRLCLSNAKISANDPLKSEDDFSNHETEEEALVSNMRLPNFRRFYIAPAPAKMGYVAAAGRFLKIMATVWAGSQVTKLARAAGALALAPFVDRGLSWFTVNYNFESQGKVARKETSIHAFMAIVGFCLGLALLLFIVVTLLSA
uniref:Uncharacterized protein n=1 Tax=Cucumis melo TaxID=3656 RepID=A0A9I9EHZ9_CUCME